MNRSAAAYNSVCNSNVWCQSFDYSITVSYPTLL